MGARSTHTPLTVALFATCINDVMFPQTCEATVAVLERLGCRIVFPEEQTCCGQMFTNTGYFDEAMGSVRSYVKAFSAYDYIVGPSGSCISSVREQHPLLAAKTHDSGLIAAVDEVVSKSYELTEFLIDVLGVEDVKACFPHRVTLHMTCHSLRNAHLGDRPYRLLQHVEGIELIPLEDYDRCCGFGGTFSVKNDAISADMAAAKAEKIIETQAEYFVGVDNACLLNIDGALHRLGSPVRPIHLAEILANAEEGVK